MVSSWSRHQTVGAETQCQGGRNLGRSKHVRASCWWPPPPPVKRRWMRCEPDLCLHFNGSAQAGCYYCPFFMMSLWRESVMAVCHSFSEEGGVRGWREGGDVAGGGGGGVQKKKTRNQFSLFHSWFLMWSHTCSHIVPLWVCARGGVVLVQRGGGGGQGVLIMSAFDEGGREWIWRGLCSSEGVVKVHVSGQVKEGLSLCLSSPRWSSKLLFPCHRPSPPTAVKIALVASRTCAGNMKLWRQVNGWESD